MGVYSVRSLLVSIELRWGSLSTDSCGLNGAFHKANSDGPPRTVCLDYHMECHNTAHS